MNMYNSLELKTWPEIEECLKKSKKVIIPLGSIEQHSKALPFCTDYIIAERIAQKASERTGILLAPTIKIGVSLVPHMAFAGTISLQPNTLSDFMEQYIRSLYVHGFREFFLINGHGNNTPSITSAFNKLCSELKGLKCSLHNWWDFEKAKSLTKKFFNEGSSNFHASASEASLILYIDESLVKKGQLSEEFLYKGKGLTMHSLDNVEKITKTGIINSDQRKAKKELGKELFDACVDEFVAVL